MRTRQWVSGLVLGLAVLCSASAARADVIVVPNAFTTTEGNIGLSTPIQSAPRTEQTVYAASQLTGIPIGSEITGLTYRLDGMTNSTAWPPSPRTWAQYNIQLSQSLNPPGSLSNTFANNIGADVVTVRSGPLTIPANAFPGGSSPNPFGIEIAFTTPYTYEGGDLLITLRATGNGVDTTFTDADTRTSFGFQTIGAASFTGTTNDGITGGTNQIAELVFTTPAVPEPSSLALLALGGGALAGWRRWRKRRTA
jgi:hypothetical protein